MSGRAGGAPDLERRIPSGGLLLNVGEQPALILRPFVGAGGRATPRIEGSATGLGLERQVWAILRFSAALGAMTTPP